MSVLNLPDEFVYDAAVKELLRKKFGKFVGGFFLGGGKLERFNRNSRLIHRK